MRPQITPHSSFSLCSAYGHLWLSDQRQVTPGFWARTSTVIPQPGATWVAGLVGGRGEEVWVHACTRMCVRPFIFTSGSPTSGVETLGQLLGDLFLCLQLRRQHASGSLKTGGNSHPLGSCRPLSGDVGFVAWAGGQMASLLLPPVGRGRAEGPREHHGQRGLD